MIWVLNKRSGELTERGNNVILLTRRDIKNIPG